MAIFDLFKFNTNEKNYVCQFTSVIDSLGLSKKEAIKIANSLLSKAVKEAEAVGLRGVCNLGDTQVSDEAFLKKRLDAGLTIEDIKKTWNRDYVLILMEKELSTIMRFTLYKHLINTQGYSSSDATHYLRQNQAYFGNPETSHENYQGEDADIYFEFRERFEKWRNKYTPEEIIDMSNRFSTYNAMIRHYIRTGDI